MQPVCPHEQSMSGVFSMASHWVLQYLPDVVVHEQTGCAHFSAFRSRHFFSPRIRTHSQRSKRHLNRSTEVFLSHKKHIWSFLQSQEEEQNLYLALTLDRVPWMFNVNCPI